LLKNTILWPFFYQTTESDRTRRDLVKYTFNAPPQIRLILFQRLQLSPRKARARERQQEKMSKTMQFCRSVQRRMQLLTPHKMGKFDLSHRSPFPPPPFSLSLFSNVKPQILSQQSTPVKGSLCAIDSAVSTV
jgi:hypothetical protein